MGSIGDTKDIVIIGGGIIGCTTAYYLTRHPSYDPSKHKITLLEASKIAGGASGKAGGLLALWAYPSSLVPLSFRLHAELAAEHGGESRWGYRRIHVGQVNARARPDIASKDPAKERGDLLSLKKRDTKAIEKLKSAGLPDDLDWLVADNVFHYQEMGDPSTTAQVHPRLFTQSMAGFAKEKGVNILEGARVTDIGRSKSGVESVSYVDQRGESQKISATDVVVSAGPWTSRVYPPAPISGMRAHSVTIEPARPVSAYALFTEIILPKGRQKQVSPEIYARPDEIYACGEGDQLVPLPETTADVEVDDSRCQEVIDQVSSISDELRYGKVTARQACYLPNVSGSVSGPLVGHADVNGLYLATGHTCWGIQNGPGTGKLMSEFVFEGKARSANIAKLDPRKAL